MTVSLAAMLSVVATASAGAPQPPPIVTYHEGAEQLMLAWLPGEVRCAGTVITPDFLPQPLRDLIWGGSPPATSKSYLFDIDVDGRPLGIRQTAKDMRTRGMADIAPSLAAARFAAGSAQSGCTITYAPRQSNLAQAPVEDLVAYSVEPQSGPLPKEAWQRIYQGGDCQDEPVPAVRMRAFPDFRAIPATPGVRAWSMVGHDIGENGETLNIRTLDGSGNSALDAAGRQAVEESGYYAGRRVGCRYPYWLNPATLPAPAAPEPESFRPAGATCPDRRDWVVAPALQYPEPYRRRSIEGWAIVTYDVAPWGEIGNIKVAASQPTEDFGNQAITVMRAAQLATTQGFVGCVNKVVFDMGATATADRNPDTTS